MTRWLMLNRSRQSKTIDWDFSFTRQLVDIPQRHKTMKEIKQEDVERDVEEGKQGEVIANGNLALVFNLMPLLELKKMHPGTSLRAPICHVNPFVPLSVRM